MAIEDSVQTRKPMNSEVGKNQLLNTSRYLAKSVILRDKEHLGKFDKKSDETIFLRYSNTSKAYRVYNKRTLAMKESINVVVDDSEST